MPEGQFSGPKQKFIYTRDGGDTIVLKLDPQLVMSNSGLTVADATSLAAASPAPKGFKPRGVFWQGTEAGFEGRRKFLIAGTTAAALYTADSPAEFDVDGVTGITTGKKGERQSFV